VHLVSGLDARLVERCHLRAVSPADHEGCLRELLRKAGPSARVGVMPYAGFTVPVVEFTREVVS
jgi:hypothetical protein